MSCEIGDIPLL